MSVLLFYKNDFGNEVEMPLNKETKPTNLEVKKTILILKW